MKKLSFIILLCMLSIYLFVSCDSGDDASSTLINNKFIINGNYYATPNAYLVFDDSSPYNDAFFLNFMNSVLIEDNVNGISVSTDLKQGIVLLVENGVVPVLTEQDINISNNTTYILEKENTIALTNVLGFEDIHILNGVTYGEPDFNVSDVYAIENSGNGTITINTIIIDFVSRTGSVDCTYQLTDDNGVLITGSYLGNFNILNGF